MGREFLQRILRFLLLLGEAMAENWIQSAIKPSNKGKLRKELKTPTGKKIPKKKLQQAAKAPGKLGLRARLAQTLSRFKKK